MIPKENLAVIGAQVYWLDPAINEVPKRSRKKHLKRIFTICLINGSDSGVLKDEDDIITLSDGTSEVETTIDELLFL